MGRKKKSASNHQNKDNGSNVEPVATPKITNFTPVSLPVQTQSRNDLASMGNLLLHLWFILVQRSLMVSLSRLGVEYLNLLYREQGPPSVQRRLAMPAPPPAWSSLFHRSPLTGKGATLQFVAPVVKEGKKLAQLQKTEVDAMTERWISSLVMYVVGDVPTIASVKRYIAANWNQVGVPNVFLHDDGYFVIKFSSLAERDEILCKGPYTFFNKPVIIKPWTAAFNFYEEVLKSCDSLSRIASLLGVPVCADDCTTRQQRVSFARLLVEMDVTANLPDHVWIEDINGTEFKQQVVYDWKPSYCKQCQMPGHNCDAVPVRKEPPVVKKVWVPKKQQNKMTTTTVVVTPTATPVNQAMPMTHSRADAGWRVATKGTRSVPIVTSNTFCPLVEDASDEELEEDEDEGALEGDLDAILPPDPLSILETRVKASKYPVVRKKFGRNWCWLENYLYCPRGRIWVGWQASLVSVKLVKSHEQVIHMEVCDLHGVFMFYFSAVYGLHTIDDRKHLWSELGGISVSVGNSPWLISGDFNALLDVQDRVNGNPVSLAEVRDFSAFVDTYQLVELKSSGHYFSCPILINCLPDDKGGGRPFRFFNYLADHHDFLPTVKLCWRHASGSTMASVWSRLKMIKQKLKNLHHQEYRGIHEKIEQARHQLSSVQTQLQQLHGDTLLLGQEQACATHLRKWLRIEESALRQKSRLQWLRAGDANNKFFFAAVKERYRINKISVLLDDNNNKLDKVDDIQAEIMKFYGSLLGSCAPTLPMIDIPVMRDGSTLSYQERALLCRPVTTREIDEALKGIDDSKAPGIDGLNAVFFKKSWEVIKADVYSAILDFFDHKKLLPQINCTTITLVPKISNPTKVKDFRPIACCTTLYKIISKILTSRLQMVVGSVVSECQAGFIPGRHIADNIMLATGLVKGYNRKHLSPKCMIKVDLKKAYDSIEWSFLVDVMRSLGFPDLFIDWIVVCISSVTYSILLNGKPCPPFAAKRG
ncbi:uncharacterized protein [Spinacia oleracea]|uniref:Reverse transcriptase domain-containing protein n=1 Tax=Spinacia oleracea TaxID=3562 RepID=A0ABM3RP87_SPIOL|nr:uncharacterized protein LOC130471371 [Spinacia oleracea]